MCRGKQLSIVFCEKYEGTTPSGEIFFEKYNSLSSRSHLLTHTELCVQAPVNQAIFRWAAHNPAFSVESIWMTNQTLCGLEMPFSVLVSIYQLGDILLFWEGSQNQYCLLV